MPVFFLTVLLFVKMVCLLFLVCNSVIEVQNLSLGLNNLLAVWSLIDATMNEETAETDTWCALETTLVPSFSFFLSRFPCPSCPSLPPSLFLLPSSLPFLVFSCVSLYSSHDVFSASLLSLAGTWTGFTLSQFSL